MRNIKVTGFFYPSESCRAKKSMHACTYTLIWKLKTVSWGPENQCRAICGSLSQLKTSWKTQNMEWTTGVTRDARRSCSSSIRWDSAKWWARSRRQSSVSLSRLCRFPSLPAKASHDPADPQQSRPTVSPCHIWEREPAVSLLMHLV